MYKIYFRVLQLLRLELNRLALEWLFFIQVDSNKHHHLRPLIISQSINFSLLLACYSLHQMTGGLQGCICTFDIIWQWGFSLCFLFSFLNYNLYSYYFIHPCQCQLLSISCFKSVCVCTFNYYYYYYLVEIQLSEGGVKRNCTHLSQRFLVHFFSTFELEAKHTKLSIFKQQTKTLKIRKKET